jgi:4-hydroxyphenylpyruvate dioxygenase
VWDYRDAWEIVRRGDHPRVGLILDSWHLLARGLPTDPIRAIPADRMTFVQLADAPRMDMDLLQWSRHFRNFPGQGDMPVDAFMEAVLATGYDGWLSLEIFNDRFRMSMPRQIAEDGERSLIWLGDRARPGALPPRVRPEAVEWIEFAVAEADEAPLTALFAGLAIVAFQPFRDFEGMPEPQRARGFERARRKFALMNELGASRILICSNVSPLALGGIDRAAADLRELGGIAPGRTRSMSQISDRSPSSAIRCGEAIRKRSLKISSDSQPS